MKEYGMNTSIADIWQMPLHRGASQHPSNGACALDAISWLMYGQLGDEPICVCPIIADYVRAINDALDDVDRQKLRPYLMRLVATVEPAVESERAQYLFNHAIRVLLPMALGNRYWWWRFKAFRQACKTFEHGETYLPRTTWKRLENQFPRSMAHFYAGREFDGRGFAVALVHDLHIRKHMKSNIVCELFAGLDGVLAIGQSGGDERLDAIQIRRSVQRFRVQAMAG